MNTQKRIEAHRIIKDNGCWETTYKYSKRPIISISGKNMQLHRVAYEIYIAPIPNGLLVCHTCDNVHCYNPKHLFLGTHSDNRKDMWAKNRNSQTQRVIHPIGANHHKAKLTEIQAEEIRSSVEKGVVLSKKYNVSEATISRIRLGRLWKHQL